MNDQLQAALANIIQKSISGVDAATDFLSQQIPDVIHQLIVWKIAQNILLICLFALITGIVFMFGKVFNRAEGGGFFKDRDGDVTFASCVIWVCLGIAFMVLFGVAVVSVFDIAELYFAPKIYLIEYAASLAQAAKGNN